MDKASLKEALSKLSVSELTEVIHDVLRKHIVHESYENGDIYEQTHALAKVSWGTVDGVTDSEPTITFLGIVHPDVSTTNWGDAICQEGKCSRCNSIICSVAKLAVCPVCEKKVSCT